jgi:hypothetical protein
MLLCNAFVHKNFALIHLCVVFMHHCFVSQLRNSDAAYKDPLIAYRGSRPPHRVREVEQRGFAGKHWISRSEPRSLVVGH